jgi:hypothetical protein
MHTYDELLNIIKETLKDFKWTENNFKDFMKEYFKKAKSYGFSKSDLIKLSLEKTRDRQDYSTINPHFSSIKVMNTDHIYINDFQLKSETKNPFYLYVNEHNEIWVIIYGKIYYSQIKNLKDCFKCIGCINVYISHDNKIYDCLGDNINQIVCNFNLLSNYSMSINYHILFIEKIPLYIKSIVDLTKQNGCCIFKNIELPPSLKILKLNILDDTKNISNFKNTTNLETLSIRYNENQLNKKKIIYYDNIWNINSITTLEIFTPFGDNIADISRNVRHLHLEYLYANINPGDLPPNLQTLTINKLYDPCSKYIDKGFIKGIIPNCIKYSNVTKNIRKHVGDKVFKIETENIYYRFIPEITLNEGLVNFNLNFINPISVLIILMKIKSLPDSLRNFKIKNFTGFESLKITILFRIIYLSGLYPNITFTLCNRIYQLNIYNIIIINKIIKYVIIDKIQISQDKKIVNKIPIINISKGEEECSFCF